MKLSKIQQGFTRAKLLIVIIIIGIIGATGWLVYDRQNDKDQSVVEHKEPSAQTPATNDAQATIKDETTDWLLYITPGNEYTIRLADGWKLERYEKTAGLATFSNNDTVLNKGTKAVVTEVNGGKDGSTGFFINFATQNIEQIVTPGTKEPSLKTNDGLEIEKYAWVVSGYSSEGLGPNNGDTQYSYVIRKSKDKVISVSYSFKPGEVDNSNVIEKVLKTVHFN